jgi:hypothetical protein
MKGARVPASVTAAGRVRRWKPWKPQTYQQAWLFAPFGPVPSGYLAAFFILAVHDGWHRPLADLVIFYPALLVGQGLAWSYEVHRRGGS